MSAVPRPATADTPVERRPPWLSRLAKVNPTRSLAFSACGAALGLLVAGFGLFTAKGTTVNHIPPEDVALVNSRPLLVSDYIAQVEAESGMPYEQVSPQARSKVLDNMIREELFVQRGLELDFPSSDSDTRAALVAAVEQQVAADVTAQQPTETELQAYYTAHRAQYASDGVMNLHELVLPGPAGPAAMAKAGEAVKALRGGMPLPAVLSIYGLKESGRVSDGDEFYFAAKIHLGEPLFNLAKTLSAGAVSEPQAAADGIHVLVMNANRMPVPQTYPEARERVFYDLKRAEQARLEDADERYLRDKADVKIVKEYR